MNQHILWRSPDCGPVKDRGCITTAPGYSFYDSRLDTLLGDFKNWLKQPVGKAFVIVFEFLLEAASYPAGNTLHLLYSIASRALYSGQHFQELSGHFG
jgi:hypothetical protein